MTATTAPTFYRTAKGSKRHMAWTCANSRRAITSGDPLVIPAAEAKDWPPCKHCCPADLVAAERAEQATQAQAKQDAQCENVGVAHPRRISSTCRSCGKAGRVVRSTGSLRPHARQA